MGVANQASAIPSQLTGYSGWAAQQNSDLSAAARRLNSALETLNQAGNSPYVLGQVAYAGNDVLGYAARNDETDSWVGSVGRAFAAVERRGIPPQVYRMDYEDYLNSKVTVADKSVTSLIGGDPVQAGRRDAAAVRLAAQLREAQDTGNAAQLKAIIGRLGAFQYDPDYCAAFFKELGSDGIRNTTALSFLDEKNPDDVALLRIYDTALASATNSVNWDPTITSGMWKPGGGASYSDMLLLKYSSVPFSEDFLTQAADSSLFYPEGVHGPLEARSASILFHALSQNPAAALDYLVGNAPDGKGGYTPFNRTVALLRDYQNDLRSNYEGEGDALSALIAAAGRSPDATTAYVGPFGTEPQIQVLLHILSVTPDPWMPEAIRPGIRQAIIDHINLFVPRVDPRHPQSPRVGSDWTWQEKIFKISVADNEGHVDLQGVKELQDAIQEWALQHVPPVSANDGRSLDAFHAYMYQVGTLWALAALPIRQGGYDAEAFRAEQIAGIKTLIGLIPIPVPLKDEGAKKIGEYVVDHVDEWAREIGAQTAEKAGGDPDKESVEAYYTQLGGMRLMLAQRYVAQHPGLIAGKTPQAAGEYIHQLAQGTDPSGGSNPNVASFELELDSASKTFAEQYNNPSR